MAALLLMVAGLQTTKAQKMRFHYSGQDTPVEYSFAGLDSMVFVDAPAAEPEYVDLGLPSGTLWATFNVGASRPEDYGDYFAWGETVQKEQYYWDTYEYSSHNTAPHYILKYNTVSSYEELIDNMTVLEAGDDAATANWGEDWRIPSDVEFSELLDARYTNVTNETRNGIYGIVVTSTKNGNSIFLPAAGYYYHDDLKDVGSSGGYWTNKLSTGSTRSLIDNSDGSDKAIIAVIKDGGISIDVETRFQGFSIRPVQRQ